MTFMPEPNRILGKRILLVDDDQGTRESIKLLLTIDRHGCRSRRRPGSNRTGGGQPFDLVILDFCMPGMQGNQAAVRIKDMAP